MQLVNVESGEQITRFCGGDFPDSAVYPRSVRMHFHSDEQGAYPGFQIIAKVVEEPADPCEGDGIAMSDEQGVIMSPNHPGNYGNNLDCTWTVQHGVCLGFFNILSIFHTV